MSASEEYVERLKLREGRVVHYEKIHIRLGNLRLGLTILAAALGWMAFVKHSISPWWTLAPVVGFVGVASYHSRILRARELAERAVVFYKNGLSRVADLWAEIGETGDRFNDPHHPYAADLDLFGKGSLFQLLSTARTRIGEETLAKWLLSPAPLQEILERHAAVAELRGQIDLREDLAVLGQDAGVGVNPSELLKWAETPNQMKPQWMRWMAQLFAALAVLAFVAWGYFHLLAPFLLIVLVEAILIYWLRKPLEAVLHETEHVFQNLDLLSGMLARVEAHAFQAPRLQALQKELISGNIPSSQAIAQLRSVVNRINSQHNLFVRLINKPLMYPVQVAFAAERWREIHGGSLRLWLNAVGEIEGLLSLANYGFEHPADPFPQFGAGVAAFEGQGLGHPLIEDTRCVRNDVSIGGETRVLLVSGSNMSGKSTLLRAVGINIVLAMAGAPVRARSLRLTPLQVGASIRMNDSLQEGSSRFYTEVARLRKLLDLAGGKPPLLFLLDELLQGTNSKDRRIGAEGIVRALMQRGAIGLISTHDLALTDMGGSENHALHNVHFQDEFKNGKMTFDYKLQEGVVTKSNGLELMRSMGIDV